MNDLWITGSLVLFLILICLIVRWVRRISDADCLSAIGSCTWRSAEEIRLALENRKQKSIGQGPVDDALRRLLDRKLIQRKMRSDKLFGDTQREFLYLRR